MSDTIPARGHEDVDAPCENPLCPGGGSETYVCDKCGHRFCEKCYLSSSEVSKFICPGGHRAVNLLMPLPIHSSAPEQREQAATAAATIYWP